MKKSILLMLSMMAILSFVTIQTLKAQDKTEPWPGVTVKVLTDNEHVKISEINIAPGAVVDWHSHPQFTTYAVTDGKMQVQIRGKETIMADIKAGEASWSPAMTHKVTNIGKTPITLIITEIKEMK